MSNTTPAATRPTEISAARLPRWRGFNLLEKFDGRRNRPFRESDFDLVREWGFDFVRLPMSYHCWGSPTDWKKIDEKVLKEIDQAVELGRQRGIHVNINFHRAPGYCVNPPEEPASLWTDGAALDACADHWAHFARRYKGITNDQLSFDLLNEPGDIPEEQYLRVHRRLVEAIRAKDDKRLIIIDGLKWGRTPVQGAVDLKVAQSTRGYAPNQISHWQASWMKGSDTWARPTWPLEIRRQRDGREIVDRWDRARLVRESIEPWKQLEQRGVSVHVGEWGAFNKTPHDVVLAWMADCLALWKQAGWGWALWNLRGSFGVLDSGRADVHYENFRTHKLDRKMLELLRAS